jgi:hypothetical protein
MDNTNNLALIAQMIESAEKKYPIRPTASA